jgi:hypothetical protein
MFTVRHLVNLARSAISIVIAALFLAASAQAQSDPLPSWNDTAPKAAIVAFVEKVTKPGSPDFVPEPERIAVFDNDGTLWVEHPMYTQLAFALDRVKTLAPQHPEWKNVQPFKAVLEGDMKTLAASGEKGLLQLIMVTHAGMTNDDFQKVVTDWLSAARDPKFKRPYTELVYQPMVELLSYLRANGFKTFIVSGGGVEFMRRKSTSSMTRPASRLGSTSRSAAGRLPPSAIPTAISKCCSGRRWRVRLRVSACSFITLMRSANTPTTAIPNSAASTRRSTRRRSPAGPSST